jgi:very-short-patch-repair endonuclease
MPRSRLLAALSRQESRRQQGQPVVSVLVGSPEQATALAHAWASERAWLVSTAPDPVEDGWAQLLRSAAVLDAVWRQLGHAARGRFPELTAYERERFWQAAAHRGAPPACRAIVEGLPLPFAPEALVPLLAPHPLPALLWLPPPAVAEAGLLRLCASALQAPRWTLLVALPESSVEGLTATPPSRERTLALEGLLRLDPEEAPLPALIAETTEIVSHAGGTVEASDRARSAAERLLFAALESRPTTQGRFGLNERADFFLAGRPVEVDLLAAGQRLAIEVDGYFHFLGPEDYRRDRRKDLALQQHGYVVLRFLADDVPVRLDEILSIVESAVAQRIRELA